VSGVIELVLSWLVSVDIQAFQIADDRLLSTTEYLVGKEDHVDNDVQETDEEGTGLIHGYIPPSTVMPRRHVGERTTLPTRRSRMRCQISVTRMYASRCVKTNNYYVLRRKTREVMLQRRPHWHDHC
jgi:hypothetical protein